MLSGKLVKIFYSGHFGGVTYVGAIYLFAADSGKICEGNSQRVCVCDADAESLSWSDIWSH